LKEDIPVIFDRKVPYDFVNDVDGWAFSKEELKNNLGKLLTLDIDFNSARSCHLNCPHCFRKNNPIDKDGDKKLRKDNEDYSFLVKVLKEAKELGLKSIKILGAGEPFEDKLFLDFLKKTSSMGIKNLVFTKGHVLGIKNFKDITEKVGNKSLGFLTFYYTDYGFRTGVDLIDELKKLNVSILLGFNAINEDVQDEMVNASGYSKLRNQALYWLIEAGFNSREYNPTRLCLATNPVTNDNYNDIFNIYVWARKRNIYVIVCPTMISGRSRGEKFWQFITPSEDKLVELYTNIYKFNIEFGINTLEQLKEEGIASYAGGHPCNQIACGMYITLSGKVLRCPGDDTTIFGNIFEKSLKEIWVKSENYGRSGMFNCGCPPKWGKSIPFNLFTDVLLKLESTYNIK